MVWCIWCFLHIWYPGSKIVNALFIISFKHNVSYFFMNESNIVVDSEQQCFVTARHEHILFL